MSGRSGQVHLVEPGRRSGKPGADQKQGQGCCGRAAEAARPRLLLAPTSQAQPLPPQALFGASAHHLPVLDGVRAVYSVCGTAHTECCCGCQTTYSLLCGALFPQSTFRSPMSRWLFDVLNFASFLLTFSYNIVLGHSSFGFASIKARWRGLPPPDTSAWVLHVHASRSSVLSALCAFYAFGALQPAPFLPSALQLHCCHVGGACDRTRTACL